jgi:hypothetical protein
MKEYNLGVDALSQRFNRTISRNFYFYRLFQCFYFQLFEITEFFSLNRCLSVTAGTNSIFHVSAIFFIRVSQ